MTLHRALAVASLLVFVGVAPAAAQFPPPPVPNQPGGASPFPPPASAPAPAPAPGGAASPFPAPGQAPAGRNPCEAFLPIRQDAEKGAAAIRAASDRKASREEVCPLFRSFAVAEAKIVKFLENNARTCNVPSDAIKAAKTNHARTIQIRNQVCSAGPAAPRGPSLSDAFSGPLVPTEPPKPGRGTFDTLTGPLAR